MDERSITPMKHRGYFVRVQLPMFDCKTGGGRASNSRPCEDAQPPVGRRDVIEEQLPLGSSTPLPSDEDDLPVVAQSIGLSSFMLACEAAADGDEALERSLREQASQAQ